MRVRCPRGELDAPEALLGPGGAGLVVRGDEGVGVLADGDEVVDDEGDAGVRCQRVFPRRTGFRGSSRLDLRAEVVEDSLERLQVGLLRVRGSFEENLFFDVGK